MRAQRLFRAAILPYGGPASGTVGRALVTGVHDSSLGPLFAEPVGPAGDALANLAAGQAINRFAGGVILTQAGNVTLAAAGGVHIISANVAGSVSLFEAARRCPTLRSLVFTSSDKAYGDHGGLPYVEEMDLRGGIWGA